MYVTVDQNKCCGAGQCVINAPEVFAQREDDRKVVLLQEEPGESQRGSVSDAVNACPTGAIEIRDDVPALPRSWGGSWDGRS